MITGGGTGTLMHDVAAGTHGEVQPGSYLLMDRQYGAIESAETDFAQALYVHATVTSADEGSGKRIIDAGSKSVDLVGGAPLVTSMHDATQATALESVTYESGGDEHGILRGVARGQLPVGSTVQLLPAHCDPTVNLHDTLVAVRGQSVEHVWPVDARGPG